MAYLYSYFKPIKSFKRHYYTVNYIAIISILHDYFTCREREISSLNNVFQIALKLTTCES